MLKIAIVTVNFNGEKDTLELFESLQKLSPSSYQLKTIVVDNGSTDNFVRSASKKYPEVDILQNGINKGFSGGYNRGIKHALIWGADYVLIINNDALTPDKNLLGTLLETFEKNPAAGIAVPKILFAPGYEFHKDRYKAEDKGKVIWFAGGTFDWSNVMSIHRGIDSVDDGTFDNEIEIDFATGCCFMVKREVLEKVGLFNEDYFAYFEDAEFSKRVLDAGFKIFHNGEVSIYHKVSQTTEIGSPLTDYYLTRNRLMFGFKYAIRRTKFALWRQTLVQLISGRKAQRQAVWDFFAGKIGARREQKWNDAAKYQVDLSIVSVNYNTPDLIDNLLKSITNNESRITNHEIIILDNGSEVNCADVVKKYPGVRFIQNSTNTGFTGGNNKAMKFSRGKYILMLNSDIEVLENSLGEIYDAANSYNGDAVVTGSLIFPDNTQQDSVFYLPTVTGAIKEYFLGLKGSFFMYAPTQEKISRVEAAAMACFLIPRKILEKAGFLDERLFTYFEDVDFCRRLKSLGIPLYYIPKAKFIHLHGATGKRLESGKTYKMLQRAAKIYYGLPYFYALTFILKICQKLSWVKTPVAR